MRAGRQSDDSPLVALEALEVRQVNPRLEPGDVTIFLGLRTLPEREVRELSPVVRQADAKIAGGVVQQYFGLVMFVTPQMKVIGLFGKAGDGAMIGVEVMDPLSRPQVARSEFSNGCDELCPFAEKWRADIRVIQKLQLRLRRGQVLNLVFDGEATRSQDRRDSRLEP